MNIIKHTRREEKRSLHTRFILVHSYQPRATSSPFNQKDFPTNLFHDYKNYAPLQVTSIFNLFRFYFTSILLHTASSGLQGLRWIIESRWKLEFETQWQMRIDNRNPKAFSFYTNMEIKLFRLLKVASAKDFSTSSSAASSLL